MIEDENVGMLDRDGKGVAGEEIGIDELHNRLLTNASFYQHKLNWRGADFDVSR
jgi:hypothetical protein